MKTVNELSEKTPPCKSHFFSVNFGFSRFIFYVYFFINPAQVLSKTNLAYYAGAFVAYSMFALFSSFVWQRLLNCLSVKISKRKALLFTWVGLGFLEHRSVVRLVRGSIKDIHVNKRLKR